MPQYEADQMPLLIPREIQALDVQKKFAGRVLQETQHMPENVHALMRAYEQKLPGLGANYHATMQTLLSFFEVTYDESRNFISGASLAYALLGRHAAVTKVDAKLQNKNVINVSQRHQKRIMKLPEEIETTTGFSPINTYCIDILKVLLSERPTFVDSVTSRMAQELDTQDQNASSDYMLGAIIVYDAFAKQAQESSMTSFVWSDRSGDADSVLDFPLLWQPEASAKFPLDYTKYLN